jgi:poly(A) polymerase
LLEQPRFRAAYDFLLLRAGESDQMRELGVWWTRAQELPAEKLAAELGGKSGGPVEHAAPAPAVNTRRRRRRGGRRRRSSAADE